MKRTTLLFADGTLLQPTVLLLVAVASGPAFVPRTMNAQSVTIVKDRNTAISKQAQNLALIPVQYQPRLSSALERILYLNTMMHGPAAGSKIDGPRAATIAPAAWHDRRTEESPLRPLSP